MKFDALITLGAGGRGLLLTNFHSCKSSSSLATYLKQKNINRYLTFKINFKNWNKINFLHLKTINTRISLYKVVKQKSVNACT